MPATGPARARHDSRKPNRAWSEVRQRLADQGAGHAGHDLHRYRRARLARGRSARGIPIARWATYRGKVYTADGSAFAISKLPNVNDNNDLIGAGYDAGSNTAFECVKVSAGY